MEVPMTEFMQILSDSDGYVATVRDGEIYIEPGDCAPSIPADP